MGMLLSRSPLLSPSVLLFCMPDPLVSLRFLVVVRSEVALKIPSMSVDGLMAPNDLVRNPFSAAQFG